MAGKMKNMIAALSHGSGDFFRASDFQDFYKGMSVPSSILHCVDNGLEFGLQVEYRTFRLALVGCTHRH